jgi:hypothetical protein
MVAIKSHDEMVENILAVYKSATVEQIAMGKDWYREANDEAQILAIDSGYSVEQAAGVIAATSPLMSWAANKRLAKRIIDGRGTVMDGYLKHNLAKANSILNGTSVWEAITANKTRAFFECILHNGNTDIVCVDRHAYGIACNERERSTQRNLSFTDKQYAGIAEAYREAARTIGISAARVQAITWVVWRNRFWAEGAFDGE